MITLDSNLNTNLYLSSTRYVESNEFIFVASSTTGTKTISKTITRISQTLRYNLFELDLSSESMPVGYYDYVILTGDFSDPIENVNRLLSENSINIIETGKMFIESVPTQISSYTPTYSSRKQYIP